MKERTDTGKKIRHVLLALMVAGALAFAFAPTATAGNPEEDECDQNGVAYQGGGARHWDNDDCRPVCPVPVIDLSGGGHRGPDICLPPCLVVGPASGGVQPALLPCIPPCENTQTLAGSDPRVLPPCIPPCGDTQTFSGGDQQRHDPCKPPCDVVVPNSGGWRHRDHCRPPCEPLQELTGSRDKDDDDDDGDWKRHRCQPPCEPTQATTGGRDWDDDDGDWKKDRCKPHDPCDGLELNLIANSGGSITVNIDHASGSDGTQLYRKVGASPPTDLGLIPSSQGSYEDNDTVIGTTYLYLGSAVVGNWTSEYCDRAETTSIPVFPSAFAASLAIALGTVGYGLVRRRR